MAVFLGSPPTPTHILVPPGVCGTWPLLAVWDPRFSPGLTANPQRTFGPSWSVRLLAAPRSLGPAVFLGSPPTHQRNLRRSASQQRRRREFCHVRLHFLQILIDLCKLVLKKLLEHRKVVSSDRLVMANVVEPAHAPDTPTCPL